MSSEVKWSEVKSLSHVRLCDPMACSPPGSLVHGIFQARVLEWVAISSSRGCSWPRDGTHVSCVSCIGSQVLLPLRHLRSWTLLNHPSITAGSVLFAQSLQSCLTLSDPMGCSPPGSCVRGILQARILAWVAISSCTRGSSQSSI